MVDAENTFLTMTTISPRISTSRSRKEVDLLAVSAKPTHFPSSPDTLNQASIRKGSCVPTDGTLQNVQ